MICIYKYILYIYISYNEVFPVWRTQNNGDFSTVGSHMRCFNSFNLWSWVVLTHHQLCKFTFNGWKRSCCSGNMIREATVLNGDFIRLNQKTIEKTGSISWFFTFFVIQFRPGSTVEKRKGLEGAKNIPKLEAGQTARSFFVGTSKGSRKPSRKLKNLIYPSYEALVSFGPYTHRISVETYFCWCPPKQGWIKSKVLFPSGRLESH